MKRRMFAGLAGSAAIASSLFGCQVVDPTPEATTPSTGAGSGGGGGLQICDDDGGSCRKAPPEATNGTKDGVETDTDCGGGNAAKCALGKACFKGSDCQTTVCFNGLCSAPSPTDGVKDLDETDVDCGGSGAPACATTKSCKEAKDCVSLVCTGEVCVEPTATDGQKNGDETDIDCGGTTTGAPPCALDKGCKVHADCATAACNYAGKCIARPSCAPHHGGDTCGPGPDGDKNGVFDDCCTSLPVPSGVAGQTYVVDKYIVTAGRMRAFVDRMDGDLRQFVSKLPEESEYWSHSWDAYIPSNREEVVQALSNYAPLSPAPTEGSQHRAGCFLDGYGARTYWIPPEQKDLVGDIAFPPEYTQEMLDEKYLNCADSYILMAFCLWDGGHLATFDEIAKTWINDKNPTGYPWTYRSPSVSLVTGADPNADGFGMPSGKDAAGHDALDYISREFGPYKYEFDEVNGPFSYWWPAQELAPADKGRRIANIAAPGRKPLGNGAYGHADILGSYQLTQVGKPTAAKPYGVDANAHANGTFEIHAIPTAPSPSPLPPYWSYWGANGRCARPSTK